MENETIYSSEHPFNVIANTLWRVVDKMRASMLYELAEEAAITADFNPFDFDEEDMKKYVHEYLFICETTDQGLIDKYGFDMVWEYYKDTWTEL